VPGRVCLAPTRTVISTARFQTGFGWRSCCLFQIRRHTPRLARIGFGQYLAKKLLRTHPPRPLAEAASSRHRLLRRLESSKEPITNASPVTSSITRSTGIRTRRIPKTPHGQEMIQREIESTDWAIDALVYELYGLTEEEIKIVDLDLS